MGRYIASTAAYMAEKKGDKRLVRIECYEANEPYCNGERIRCEWGVVVFHPVDERDKYKETIGTPIMITKNEWSNRPTDSDAFDKWVFDKCGFGKLEKL